jgi:hypothetical protein
MPPGPWIRRCQYQELVQALYPNLSRGNFANTGKISEIAGK